MRLLRVGLLAGTVLASGPTYGQEKVSAIDRYLREAGARTAQQPRAPGSLYTPTGLLADAVRDLRAHRVDDIVTIVVADRASAVSRGTTRTARDSSAGYGVNALFGTRPAGGVFANLARLKGSSEVDGEGETTRETKLTTTLSARVTHVLPNGNLVVEGSKEVVVNSERQTIVVRGIVRWNDLDPDNRVSSDRLADLEIKINGKGVVGDAIRRPNFLYRLLLGILPF